jgi:DNA-binding transcriptional LysR family regulator
MNKDINLSDVRSFVVIAKSGSFTAAAELLMCSRSHLSKQLLQLENTLGVKLITRTTRTQRLTEQGRHFFDQCNQALHVIDNAVENTMNNAETIKGNININCVGGFIGEEMIASLVNDFLKSNPNITINLDFSSRRVDLIAKEFDVVFRMGQLEDSNLIGRKLIDIPISLLASPSYLKSNAKLNQPNDLSQHQCITGSLNEWTFCNMKQPSEIVKVTVGGSFTCKNGRAMLNSALAGNGITRLPSFCCHKEISEGLLVPVFTQWAITETPLYLVYVKDKFQPQRLKSFIQFTRDNISNYIPSD